MEIHILLMHLALIFLAAVLFSEVIAIFGIPAVVGELLAGVLIGPSVLGWVALSPSIELIAEIGVIFLLFEVGIETDLKKLFSAGIKAFLVALGGIIFPFIFGMYVSKVYLGLSFIVALFVGGTLTATSLGVTLRVLRDMRQQTSPEAQVITGAAIIDDIVGILLLSVLYEFSINGRLEVVSASLSLFGTICFLAIIPFFIKKGIMLLEQWHNKTSVTGLIPLVITVLILFAAYISHTIGAPALLGGFAAGLACSKHFIKSSTVFSKLIEEKMHSIVLLFTPVFFVSIGLSLHLQDIAWDSLAIWKTTGYLSLAAILGKLLSGFLATKENIKKKLAIGTAMIPRGEMGLIFASVGLAAGVFSKDIYTSMIVVIVITTIVAPCFLKFFYRKGSNG